MKKGNRVFSFVVKAMVLVFGVALVQACADGAHLQPKALDAALNMPTITKFTVSKVGGSGAPGSSVTIAEGDSVLLEWEVTGPISEDAVEEAPEESEAAKAAKAADEPAAEETENAIQVTLDSEALGIHEKGLSAVGSKQIDDVKTDAVFVLTAALGEAVVTQQVSVIVEAALAPMEASLTAKPSEINKGESSEICWEVSRSEASITIIDSEGNTIVSDDNKVESEEVEPPQVTAEQPAVTDENAEAEVNVEEQALAAKAAETLVDENIDTSPVVTNVTSKDCVMVTPEKDTTYFFSASAKDADTVKKEISVTVMEKLEVAQFSATPDKIAGEQEVTLSWKVTPADASVTITNVEGALSAEGTSKITISETTTFTLTATYEEKSVTRDLVVPFEAMTITLTPSINGTVVVDGLSGGSFFAGESVDVAWDATVAGNATATANVKVTVSGVEGEQVAKSNAKVFVPASGEITITAAITGMPPASQIVKLNVRKWAGVGEREDGAPVSALSQAADAADSAWIGFRSDLTDDGLLRIGKIRNIGDTVSTTMYDIKFQKLFESDDTYGLAGKWHPKFIKDINTFPVNTIVVDDKGRIFVGTSGGIVFSDDNASDWKGLVFGPLLDDGKYPGSHRSCKGKMQDGRTKHDGFPVSLMQVCDMVVDDSGKFIAATDHFVAYLPEGVDEYLVDKMAHGWVGLPAAGKEGNAVFGTVNHDLELVTVGGEKKLYSATDKGLFVTPFGTQKDFAWQQVSGIEGAVISVRADVVGNKLYVGKEDGIYVSDLANGGTWTKAAGIDGAAYEIEIDSAQAGTVYAATGAGVKVSRNCGTAWTDITNGAMSGAAAVEAIAVAKVANNVGVFAAADKGAFASVAAVASEAVEPSAENPPEETGETQAYEETPTDITGPTVGGEGTTDGGELTPAAVNQSLL